MQPTQETQATITPSNLLYFFIDRWLLKVEQMNNYPTEKVTVLFKEDMRRFRRIYIIGLMLLVSITQEEEMQQRAMRILGYCSVMLKSVLSYQKDDGYYTTVNNKDLVAVQRNKVSINK